MEKKVEDNAAKNVASHQLPHQMPLCSGTENIDPNQHLENLVERAKGLKKKKVARVENKSKVGLRSKPKKRIELN